jgi:hypothetical protein
MLANVKLKTKVVVAGATLAFTGGLAAGAVYVANALQPVNPPGFGQTWHYSKSGGTYGWSNDGFGFGHNNG